ncbi:hypothetical protein PG996_004934 [Apiospora saccharicola]|uniref:ASX DEUBAD domain-containing protein n=1 Tax=Apiospora saccharicola TaxID=335842 RepID=A0ABR1VMT1_9PEZI
MTSPANNTRPTAAPKAETHHSGDLWGRILFKNNREPRDARFKDDTGTPVNWIHPSLAKRFKLDIEQLEEREIKDFVDFQGRKYRARQIVYFTMMGRNQKTYWNKYYVASEKSNIDVILGDEFVNANGRARDVCDTAPHAAPAQVFVLERKVTFWQNNVKEQMDAGQAKNDREAQELAEKKRRKSQRDREGKSKSEGLKSHKKENK